MNQVFKKPGDKYRNFVQQRSDLPSLLFCSFFSVSRDMKLNPQQAPLYVSITSYSRNTKASPQPPLFSLSTELSWTLMVLSVQCVRNEFMRAWYTMKWGIGHATITAQVAWIQDEPFNYQKAHLHLVIMSQITVYIWENLPKNLPVLFGFFIPI